MGACCTSSDRKNDADAARQLESLFVLGNKDLVRSGTQEDLLKFYEVLDQEVQSHENCYTCTLVDKASNENRFCKVINKKDSMPMQSIEKTLKFMSTVSNSIVCKVQEIYHSNDKIFLVSDSLKGTHKPLAELETILDEGKITRIVEKLLVLCN